MQQQPKYLILLVLAAILIGSANCDSSSSDGEDGLWSRLKTMVREFMDSMKKIWRDMRAEIESRTSDVTTWTKELYDSFKIKMKEWVDQVGSASEKEKEDMKNYIERLEMPKDNEK